MKLLRKLTALAAALVMAVTPIVSGAANVTEDSGTYAVAERREGVKSAKDLSLTANNVVQVDGKTICGFTKRHSEGYCADMDVVLPIEADYGLTASADKTVISIKGYDYTGKNITIKSANIYGASFSGGSSVTIKTGKWTKIDTKKYKTGLYHVTAKFSNKKSLDLYFYVNKDAVKPCIVDDSSYKTVKNRRSALVAAMKTAAKSSVNGGFATDGSKSLDLKNFYYPNYTFGDEKKYRCDTDRWAKLSKQLCDSSWSKEHKAYVLAMWIVDNLAYDNYMVDKLENSRSNTYKDWSGKYSVWNTRAGVCWDFSNIYAIMCRAQGIPCTVAGSTDLNHQWSLVMLNGRWTELDLTDYCTYEVNGKNTSTRTKYDNVERNFRQHAFNEMPNGYDTPKDLDVNIGINYGDPENPDDDVYYLS